MDASQRQTSRQSEPAGRQPQARAASRRTRRLVAASSAGRQGTDLLILPPPVDLDDLLLELLDRALEPLGLGLEQVVVDQVGVRPVLGQELEVQLPACASRHEGITKHQRSYTAGARSGREEGRSREGARVDAPDVQVLELRPRVVRRPLPVVLGRLAVLCRRRERVARLVEGRQLWVGPREGREGASGLGELGGVAAGRGLAGRHGPADWGSFRVAKAGPASSGIREEDPGQRRGPAGLEAAVAWRAAGTERRGTHLEQVGLVDGALRQAAVLVAHGAARAQLERDERLGLLAQSCRSLSAERRRSAPGWEAREPAGWAARRATREGRAGRTGNRLEVVVDVRQRVDDILESGLVC